MIKKPKPRILAIDPGTRHIGIAVLQGSDLIYHGVVSMPYRRSPAAIRRNTRVLFRLLLSDFRPAVLAIEENSIGGDRAKSLLHAVVSETVRLGRREGVEVVTKSASSVKKFVTGNGRASKEEVAHAVARCYPELKAYLRQTAKWRARYHGNMFDAVALGLTVGNKSLNPLARTRSLSLSSAKVTRLARWLFRNPPPYPRHGRAAGTVSLKRGVPLHRVACDVP